MELTELIRLEKVGRSECVPQEVRYAMEKNQLIVVKNELAKTWSKAENYPDVAASALLAMREGVGKDIVIEGLMKRGIVVRHLILPNQIENNRQVIDWILKNLGEETFFSLMSQHTSCGESLQIDALNRPIKPLEYKILTNYVEYGLSNVFVQDLSSRGEEYTPEFFGDSYKE